MRPNVQNRWGDLQGSELMRHCTYVLYIISVWNDHKIDPFISALL